MVPKLPHFCFAGCVYGHRPSLRLGLEFESAETPLSFQLGSSGSMLANGSGLRSGQRRIGPPPRGGAGRRADAAAAIVHVKPRRRAVFCRRAERLAGGCRERASIAVGDCPRQRWRLHTGFASLATNAHARCGHERLCSPGNAGRSCSQSGGSRSPTASRGHGGFARRSLSAVAGFLGIEPVDAEPLESNSQEVNGQLIAALGTRAFQRISQYWAHQPSALQHDQPDGGAFVLRRALILSGAFLFLGPRPFTWWAGQRILVSQHGCSHDGAARAGDGSAHDGCAF